MVSSITTNGTSFGNLDGISIDDQGFVTASYDNGVTRQIAQVATATFLNPDGLRSVTGDAYRVTIESGAYNLKDPRFRWRGWHHLGRARGFDCRSVVGIHRSDHHPARILGVIQDSSPLQTRCCRS